MLTAAYSALQFHTASRLERKSLEVQPDASVSRANAESDGVRECGRIQFYMHVCGNGPCASGKRPRQPGRRMKIQTRRSSMPIAPQILAETAIRQPRFQSRYFGSSLSFRAPGLLLNLDVSSLAQCDQLDECGRGSYAARVVMNNW